MPGVGLAETVPPVPRLPKAPLDTKCKKKGSNKTGIAQTAAKDKQIGAARPVGVDDDRCKRTPVKPRNSVRGGKQSLPKRSTKLLPKGHIFLLDFKLTRSRLSLGLTNGGLGKG